MYDLDRFLSAAYSITKGECFTSLFHNRGKLKVATKEDLLKNKDEYILFGKAKNNKSREGMEH